MESLLDLTFLIPALPLLGVVLLLAFGRRLGDPWSGWLATAMVWASFVVSVLVFLGLTDRPEEARGPVGGEEPFTQTLWEWIPVGGFSVDIAFLVDPLAMDLVLFVTFVGALIHTFAIGYMRGDGDFPKFFLYLNLFVFSMLVLVLGDNMLLTFLGWEGVGACSYLLISFWFSDEANASAGKKAFITNRIGDWGFMVAMFAVFLTFGTLTYSEMLPEASGLTQSTATAITLLLLIGAVGKSAQLPLYLWLPDAMAGPTPVSALIHAATMVTSGVFLLTRMNPVLDVSAAWSLDLIAWVGAITALFAATIAVAQNDIKKVLAYSTVSQLGYLFVAVGTGSYVAGIFHMTTHASFKALLFLGAGSVIHGMHHDQDMRHYGALRRLLPITAFTFIIGWLAIAGVPPFSGFWSKDEVLLGAFDVGGFQGTALWVLGIVTALLTAFYMTRQVMMTFFGRYRYADARPDEIDEAWA
ncbi:MAG: NADH-quinone oxidoreductase subunit L, partial [Acidimicrobiia bacterium]|nr:NADH-quinone oxidoreductase subunit L [Acidimicrobiia bacterium]